MPKFCSPHPHPPTPCPAAARWWAQTTVEEDGGMEATAAEARNSLNWDREQVFLLSQASPDLSEEE